MKNPLDMKMLPLNEDRGVLIDTVTERNLDTLLQLVADRHRRQAVQQLRHEATGRMTIDDLVDRLRTGGPVADDQTTPREQLAIQLHHAHLPKLADYGIVDFDPENGTVRYQPDEQIEAALDSLPDPLSLAHP